MTYENIIYEKQGRIARLTLNRPQVLNAMNWALLEEIEAALKEAEDDDEVRVVILKGAGRAFCAGSDIEQGGYYGERPILGELAWVQRVNRYITAIWNLRKPVIAQVHGYCIGGAMDICCSAKRVFVIMEHVTAEGLPRIKHECTYPLTAFKVVSTVFTNLAVIDVTPEGMVLREVAPGVSPAEVQAETEPTLVLPEHVREMSL